jgi:hypothetical protein
LTGFTIGQRYGDYIQLSNSGLGVSASLKTVYDGLGNALPFQISSTAISFTGTTTGYNVSGLAGLGTGVATFLTTPSSANLLAALTTSTGSGNAVFATSPTFVTPVLGTPTSGTLTNCTGYTDANLSTSDVTTNNVTTSKHGFCPKAPNDVTKFLDGTGAFSVPGGSGVNIVSINVITSTGTYTPPAGLIYAVIEATGGGGGGAGCAAGGAGTAVASEGGAAAGYSKGVYSKATIIGAGTAATVTIGALGAGGSAGGNNGSAGGNTTIVANSGGGATLMTCNGGGGGAAQTASASAATQAGNGAGGTASGGSINLSGAASSAALIFAGGAGSLAFQGSSTLLGYGGAYNNAGGGIAASGYGAGGSGGATGASTNRTGGNGSPGVVIITEYRSS